MYNSGLDLIRWERGVIEKRRYTGMKYSIGQREWGVGKREYG